MDDAALRQIMRRLDQLERTSVRTRLGEVTDDSPLTITLGGDDTDIADAPHLADATLDTGDPVAALTAGNGLLVLGRVGDPPAWTAYTPTISTALGTGGTVVAAYSKAGRRVDYHGRIVCGSGGLTGNPVTISLPFAAAARAQIGAMTANDVTNRLYVGAATIDSGASVLKGQFEGGAYLHASGPFAWGTSDVLTWAVTYEAAA